mmetsp:Transcript_52364/g.83133  ORF Transcript_52364/g.83133 Transcript_52364/m.83133 type:complete len:214 (-) Transcript_52364:264-905(-)
MLQTPVSPPSFVNNAPTKVCGIMLTRMTGRVPMSICGILSCRIPHSMLTGKSGPATNIQTFPGFMPLSFNTFSIARVGTLSTPTNCCTLMNLPAINPRPYCPQQAIIFAREPTMHAIPVPGQNPTEPSICPCAPSTTPANKYTALPGTIGHINIPKPMINTIPETTANSMSAFSKLSFSHEKKTNVNLEPTINTTNSSPRRITFVKILTQFHV